MSKRMKKIQDRLESIDGGFWRKVLQRDNSGWGIQDDHLALGVMYDKKDATFVVKARDDMAYLLNVIAKRDRMIEQWRQHPGLVLNDDGSVLVAPRGKSELIAMFSTPYRGKHRGEGKEFREHAPDPLRTEFWAQNGAPGRFYDATKGVVRPRCWCGYFVIGGTILGDKTGYMECPGRRSHDFTNTGGKHRLEVSR